MGAARAGALVYNPTIIRALSRSATRVPQCGTIRIAYAPRPAPQPGNSRRPAPGRPAPGQGSDCPACPPPARGRGAHPRTTWLHVHKVTVAHAKIRAGAWKELDVEGERLTRAAASMGAETLAKLKDQNILVVGCQGAFSTPRGLSGAKPAPHPAVQIDNRPPGRRRGRGDGQEPHPLERRRRVGMGSGGDGARAVLGGRCRFGRPLSRVTAALDKCHT